VARARARVAAAWLCRCLTTEVRNCYTVTTVATTSAERGRVVDFACGEYA
jgi:hypothetical protein